MHWPKDADPHAHYLLRTGGDLHEELLLQLWRRSCPRDAHDGADAHLDTVRSAPALARYVTHNAGVLPSDWRGQPVTYSAGFLLAPVRVLWQECLAGWYGGRSPYQ